MSFQRNVSLEVDCHTLNAVLKCETVEVVRQDGLYVIHLHLFKYQQIGHVIKHGKGFTGFNKGLQFAMI